MTTEDMFSKKKYKTIKNIKPFDLLINISYTPYTGCVLDHILHNNILTNQQKLFYLLDDSLALINSKNNTLCRTTDLSASKWSEILNCSKSKIFSMQKDMEIKGYFILTRGKNKFGKNKRNIISPTLPDQVFNNLIIEPNRFNINQSLYDYNIFANKRAYLDQTKLFVKLNYKLLQYIASNANLSLFAKILWLSFYLKSYKKRIKNNDHKDKMNLSLTICYKELEKKFNCSKETISKAMTKLKKFGFIEKKRFYIKNKNLDDNLHDKSLWIITLTIPNSYQQLITKFESKVTNNIKVDKIKVSSCDPYVAKTKHIYNKYYILKNNILNNFLINKINDKIFILKNYYKKCFNFFDILLKTKTFFVFVKTREKYYTKIKHIFYFLLTNIKNIYSFFKLYFFLNKIFISLNDVIIYISKTFYYEKFIKKLSGRKDVKNKTRVVSLFKNIILPFFQKLILKNILNFLHDSIAIYYKKFVIKKSKVSVIIENKNSVWYKIRQDIKICLHDGVFIDKIWLSQLFVEENENNNTIIVFARSNFIRDYVNNKYKHLIQYCAQKLQYTITDILTKNYKVNN